MGDKNTLNYSPNPMDIYKNIRSKSAAWMLACENDVMAVTSKGKMVPVKDYNVHELAFIGGMWRVQKDLNYDITRVRDKDMVLMQRLNRVENTLFEFWTAKIVGYNCYGPFITGSMEKPDYIVSKYETDKETYWGYGKTLEEARAFLGLKLYDEYKDIINSIACKNKLQNK